MQSLLTSSKNWHSEHFQRILCTPLFEHLCDAMEKSIRLQDYESTITSQLCTVIETALTKISSKGAILRDGTNATLVPSRGIALPPASNKITRDLSHLRPASNTVSRNLSHPHPAWHTVSRDLSHPRIPSRGICPTPAQLRIPYPGICLIPDQLRIPSRGVFLTILIPSYNNCAFPPSLFL